MTKQDDFDSINSILSTRHAGNNDPTMASSSSSSSNQNHHDNNSVMKNISIVVPLRYEMGNHLSQIAHGYGLLWEARRGRHRDDQLPPHNVVLVHRPRLDKKNQTKHHHQQSLRDLYQCFPNLRPLLFGPYGNQTSTTEPNDTSFHTEEYPHSPLTHNERVEQWFVNHTSHIESTLRAVKEWMFTPSRDDGTIRKNGNELHLPNARSTKSPSIVVEMDYVAVNYLADKYYDEYRTLFQFDHEACCKLKPDPDESVYHFRNYGTEMRQFARSQGFEEMEPRRVANELFAHLQPGDKVAITTRYQSRLHRLVHCLTQRGLQVRVIKQQSGIQDFCFLLHAQKELVGVAESTFVLWAGYLGHARNVRLYSMDSPARRNATTSLFAHRVFVHYNWTHPTLKKKVFFELYQVNRTKG